MEEKSIVQSENSLSAETKKNNQIDLTPKQIVERLDNYIIGQKNAKRSVAIALRNRVRRLKHSE